MAKYKRKRKKPKLSLTIETPAEKAAREERENGLLEDMTNDPRRDWVVGRINPVIEDE